MSSIAQAFRNLAISAEDASDHESIYEVSYEYLSKVKNYDDVKSFHNCMVSLINMDKYQQAHKLVQKVPEHIHSQFPVEKAYVYYKLGKSKLVAEVYQQRDQSDPLSDRALKHVYAQDCYRNGDNATALSLMHELIQSNSKIDSESDLGCNERAVLSQWKSMDASSRGQLSTESEPQNYDCLFNDSLILISENRLADALESLTRAESVCSSQNEHLPASDLLLELAPIKLSIAYIYQVQGRTDEARSLLAQLQDKDNADLMTQLISSNNYYALGPIGDTQLSMALRDLDYQAKISRLLQKLTKPQLHVLMKNKLLLQYHAHTLSKSALNLQNGAAGDLHRLYPGDYTILAYKVLHRLDITIADINDQATACAKKLYKHARSTSGEEKTATALLLVAANVVTRRFDQCVSVLEEIWEKDGLVPAVAGVLLSLLRSLSHHHNGVVPKAKEKESAFVDALVKKFVENGVSKCYQFAREVAFTLYQADNDSAGDIFLILHRENPNDELVAAALNGSSARLESIDKLRSTRDINELLDTSIASMIPPPPPKTPRKVAAAHVLKVHKSTRKPRFSAKREFVPASKFDAAELDEERWLPMRLRSYYKPTKKDKKKGGQQGAMEQPKDKKKRLKK